jgi:tRNA A-37 threonylcarbamoyl transferase component Bud32
MEDDTNIYIVMEYISGHHMLNRLSDNDAALTEREIGNYIH